MSRCFSFLMALLVISGCSTTSKSFYSNPYAANDTSLCRAYSKTSDVTYKRDISQELDRRSISLSHCKKLVRNENTKIAAVVVLGTLAAVACANSTGCGSGYSGYEQADWDQFYNQYYQLVWRCREIRTGRFTYDSNCSGKFKTDSRWPSKMRSI